MERYKQKMKTLDIKRGEIAVIIIPDKTYSKDIIDITIQQAKDYRSLCYVSLNKPHDSLIKTLRDNNVDTSKFLFIDAITKPFKSVKKLDNCIFVSSIHAIGELSIAIEKSLEKGKFDTLIFDSLSTMLIYHHASVTTKFIHSLIGRLRVLNCAAVFTCLESDEESSLVKDLGMIVDKIMEVEELQEKGKAEEIKSIYVDVLGPLGIEQFKKIEQNLNTNTIIKQIEELKELRILNEQEAEEFKNRVKKEVKIET